MQAPTYSHADAAVLNGAMQDLGDRIRACRIKAGITQGRLGEMVGVSAQAVTQWESGENKPSRKNLERVANALGVSIDYLVNGTLLPERDGNATVRMFAERGRVVPMYSQEAIAHNAGIEGLQPTETTVSFASGQPASFATVIDGSENAPDLVKGDIAFWEAGAEPLPGDMVLAVVAESHAVVGEFRREALASGIVTIVAPADTRWPAARSDLATLKIIGVLRSYTRAISSRR